MHWLLGSRYSTRKRLHYSALSLAAFYIATIKKDRVLRVRVMNHDKVELSVITRSYLERIFGELRNSYLNAPWNGPIEIDWNKSRWFNRYKILELVYPYYFTSIYPADVGSTLWLTFVCRSHWKNLVSLLQWKLFARAFCSEIFLRLSQNENVIGKSLCTRSLCPKHPWTQI